MEDRVDGTVEEDVLRDVVEDEAELPVPDEVRDVPLVAGDEVVEPDDLVPLREEPVREVASEEPGDARDDDAHHPLPRPAYVQPRRRISAGS